MLGAWLAHDQSPAPEARVPIRGTGGAPPKRDWDVFWIEVARYAAKNDLMPEDRPELQKHLERWAIDKDPKEPMDGSTIRRKLAKLFAPN